ncbi:H+/gluconate symporter family protein [Corynebacterium mustelae]|uniref:H+/gluconate symporter family protein n=1 Tax=Corynebacterium mustelae TaxID=571915 RepID=A0A0G3GWN3_9CORY|nr:GntP family permease [Corynebacterium mustelae]AKK05574.1 H+/gluconate symporter family protein [Corynebacterium mustelae]
MVVALIGIVLSLIVLMGLAYRGHSVVVVAPIAALVAAIFSGAPLLASYTQIFMPALGKFIVSFFPLFLAGAIFGKLMTASGLATDLAKGISRLFGPKHAMLSTVLATALLTYGGVSAWVVAFTIVPIAIELFREAHIPKRLMPGALGLGTITFALAALPGSPQVHNVIPTRYFGTTSYAAPAIGLIAAILMFGLGMMWLEFRIRQLQKAGEDFLPEGTVDETPAEIVFHKDGIDMEGVSETAVHHPKTGGNVAINGLLGLLPIAVVIVMNYLFVYVIANKMDFSYLAEEKFGAVNLDAVIGVWSVVVGLVTAIILIFIMRLGMIKELFADLSEGAKNAVLPAFTTASEVGYGAVVASLAAFAAVREGIFGTFDNALVVSTVSAAVISGITGSSSGGLSITLAAFGEELKEMAINQGIDLEVMHRITAMASVSFDSLPHNGAILTMLIVCGMTHRQSYKDVAMVTVVIPLLVVATMLIGILAL